MARQRTFFHKCHRCIYRGQPANWEPAEAPMAMLNVHAAEEPADAAVMPIEIAAPVRIPKTGSKTTNKSASKPGKKEKPAPKTVDASV
jgi:hypothetical protein